MYTYDVIKNGIKVAEFSSEEELSQADIDRISAPYLQEPRVISQKEKDFERYTKRAIAKNMIIAEMATENMERIRSGVWNVSDIISLTQDEQVREVLNDVYSLSFEIATVKLMSLTNVLITNEIKAIWVEKLQKHFYL